MAAEVQAATGRSVPWWRVVVGVALAAVALYIPWMYNPETNQIFGQVMYLAIAAMGLNLLTGFNGQVSIGHGAFFGLGAFTTAVLMVDHGVSFELTIVVGAIFAAVQDDPATDGIIDGNMIFRWRRAFAFHRDFLPGVLLKIKRPNFI